MEKFELTAARARELFHYDPDTGILTWKVNRRKARAGDVAGTLTDDGYLVVTVHGRQHRVHRLAWLIQTGSWPENGLDHEDRVRTNNRFTNLRDVPQAVNAQNRGLSKNNSTGFLGVVPNGSRFQARIQTAGVETYLGTFGTPELAHEAYVTAKRQMHAGSTI